MRPFIKRDRKGFTIIEMIISFGIAMFVAAMSWSIYSTSTTWSKQRLPEIEAQRIARISITAIVDGFRDVSAGTDTISGHVLSRRNGITCATAVPIILTNSTTDKITYNLEGLSNQTFYTLKNESPMKLYHNSTAVPGTTGITSLTFEQVANTKMYTITVKVEKNIVIGNQITYPVKAELSETVFLRNI
jgi:hypothetical protein